MKLFKGWSEMTYEMKHKPIKEGYKFFALNDAMTGYCFVVFPAGKLDKKKGQTWDIVEKLIKHLPGHKECKYVACMDNWFTCPKTFWLVPITTLLLSVRRVIQHCHLKSTKWQKRRKRTRMVSQLFDRHVPRLLTSDTILCM